MNPHVTNRSVFSVLFILPFFFGGCFNSPPSRFYTLNMISGPEQKLDTRHLADHLIIGVGPVKIPKYLDRTKIVYRTGEKNRVEIANFDLWAGSLKEDLPSILAEDISILLCSDRVISYPWRAAVPVDYQITIDFIRFDATPGKTVTLLARWSIFSDNGKKLVKLDKSFINEAISGTGIDSMIEAQNKALNQLSTDIARTVIKISGD